MKDNIQWTAIFIVLAGSDLEFQMECRRLINELLSTKLTKNVKIAICLNNQVSEFKKMDSNFQYTIEQNDDPVTTVIYSIEKSLIQDVNELIFHEEIKDFRMQNGQDITTFFRKIINIKLKSNRYALFTWDHGSMYGIFPKESSQINIAEKMIPHKDDIFFQKIRNIDKFKSVIIATKIRNYLKSNTYSKQIKSDTKIVTQEHEDTTPDILTNAEISRAINEAFEKKIDLLVMINCYMQEFDTGYELKDTVKYFIAPSGVIDMRGLDYKKIIETIARNPCKPLNAIARTAIRSYKQKCLTISDAERRSSALDDTLIFAISLKHYQHLADILDEMAKILKSYLTSKPGYAIISAARNKTLSLKTAPHLNIVDAFDFLNRVGKRLNDKKFNKYLRIFNKLHKDTVKYKFVGKSFVSDGKTIKFHPNGFTVYFPDSKNAADLPETLEVFLDQTNQDANSFVKQKSWDDFVIQYAEMANNRIAYSK